MKNTETKRLWEKEVYRSLKLRDKEIISSNWSRTGGTAKKSSLHSIASYLAMFAPALPEFFINKYSKKNDLILDPFSGRGTTALRARELNRRFVGSDLNPYALVLTRFKISTVYKIETLKRLICWENQFQKESNKWFEKTRQFINKELLNYYHTETLAMLLFFRSKIGSQWDKNNSLDNAILAFALGIMHGPSRKNNETIYFSVSKPNSISMSPNYVKKYVKRNKLTKPSINIFHNIANRINTKYDDLLQKKYDGQIYKHDATEENKYIKNNSVALVVTSPPYLSLVNYTNSNWLKLWLLNFERNQLRHKIKLTDNLNFQQYILFIKKFLQAIYPKLKKQAKVCLVVGDIFNKKVIEEVWQKIEDEVPYKFVEIYYDISYLQTRKTTNMLNKRKGKATKIEKVLVVEKK